MSPFCSLQPQSTKKRFCLQAAGIGTLMLRLNPERLATQVAWADLALNLASELKLEQEEDLKGVLTGVSFLPYIK